MLAEGLPSNGDETNRSQAVKPAVCAYGKGAAREAFVTPNVVGSK